MSSESSVSVAHLLAAREDLSQIYKTASGKTRHSCKINKVQMGAVPDRGGRCNEGDAPPPECQVGRKGSQVITTKVVVTIQTVITGVIVVRTKIINDLIQEVIEAT